MEYSILKDTMADMSYVEIEKAAKSGHIVYLPISVIEEHGPHLSLATLPRTGFAFSSVKV